MTINMFTIHEEDMRFTDKAIAHGSNIEEA